jgi:hypothetical protein
VLAIMYDDVGRMVNSYRLVYYPDTGITYGLKPYVLDREFHGLIGGMAIDQRYYAHVPPNSFSERLMISARDRIFSDFMSRMLPSPDHRILDVGVSDVVSDGANVLERSYPYPENITACGLSDAPDFRAAFPNVNYRRIEPNTSLPFDANRFDIATANAVLEHVGSFEKQVLFVGELCRIARRVFISVPNKFFPVEHHTALPLVHYHPHMFRMACRLTSQDDWANDENLILMTRKRLRRIAAPSGRVTTVGYTGLRLGPFSSNLFLILN